LSIHQPLATERLLGHAVQRVIYAMLDSQLPRVAMSSLFLLGELLGAPAGDEFADRLFGQSGLAGDR
jgi:hypothetical protein